MTCEHLAQAAAVGVALEHPVLEGADAVGEAVDLGEVAVDDGVEHEYSSSPTPPPPSRRPPRIAAEGASTSGVGSQLTRHQPAGADEDVDLGEPELGLGQAS